MVWPTTIKEAIEDFKAWKRGEVRVLPGLRGRVYARKSEIDYSPNAISTKIQLTGQLTPSRIWKDSDKRWYTIEEYRELFKETD